MTHTLSFPASRFQSSPAPSGQELHTGRQSLPTESQFQSSPAPSGQELPICKTDDSRSLSSFNPLPPHRGRSYYARSLLGACAIRFQSSPAPSGQELPRPASRRSQRPHVSILSRPIGAGATARTRSDRRESWRVSILSRPIGAGATKQCLATTPCTRSFNPLPPHRGRSYPLGSWGKTGSLHVSILSRPIGAGATCRADLSPGQQRHVSILSRPIGAGATPRNAVCNLVHILFQSSPAPSGQELLDRFRQWGEPFFEFQSSPAPSGQELRSTPGFELGARLGFQSSPAPSGQELRQLIHAGVFCQIVSILSRPIGAGATSRFVSPC